MMRDNVEWLSRLNVGDEVAVAGDHGRSWSIFKVGRMTATQIICPTPRGAERKFRRLNGREIGSTSTWGFACIGPVTAEVRDSITRRNLLAYIEASNRMNQLPTSTLAEIAKIMKATGDVAKLLATKKETP